MSRQTLQPNWLPCLFNFFLFEYKVFFFYFCALRQMAAQCASYISVGRSYFLINGLLFYHLAPELSRRAALAIRNVPVAQRNIPFHSVPFHVELCGMYRGMESRSVRHASGKDKIRFSFGRPATVALQLFSFLFVVFSFLFFSFFVGFCCC